ncbi:hypothetical protein [Streptomyces rochei]|uniref:hypothetical protein n=1 Tax=Streptomyces rochei TaxID=1928 RepID=UPI003701ED95
MADSEYFEIPGEGTFPNRETAIDHARKVAKGTDVVLEIYRVRRTLVRTVQRTVTVEEKDPSTT